MTEQALDERQFQAALDAGSGVRVTKQMNAAFAPHAALLDGTVIDVLAGAFIDGLRGFAAQEQPGAVRQPGGSDGPAGHTPPVEGFLRAKRG
jgi:hypothetical protein